MGPANRRRPGLSRVEVIASAGAILLVLVLAGWGAARSREGARSKACMNILARYGRAMAQYAETFDGALPYENTGDEDQGHVVWDEVLRDYLSGGPSICPSVDPDEPNRREAYRINSKLGRRNADPPMPYRLLQRLDRPGDTVVLFDAEYGGRKLSLKGGLSEVSFRHRGSANLLFADWRVAGYDAPALQEASDWIPPKVVWDPEAARALQSVGSGS